MKVKQDEGAGSAGTEGKGCSKGWHRLAVKMSKAVNGVLGGLDGWWKASQAEGTGGARVLKEVLSSLSENQQGGQHEQGREWQRWGQWDMGRSRPSKSRWVFVSLWPLLWAEKWCRWSSVKGLLELWFWGLTRVWAERPLGAVEVVRRGCIPNVSCGYQQQDFSTD